MTKTKNEKPEAGVRFGRVATGKTIFRVSEQYLAEHLAPLIRARRPEAAKIDLVLRAVALSPGHNGERPVGTVLRLRGLFDYAEIHDLVRDARRFSMTPPEDDDDDAKERELKREWVRQQLCLLEERRLLTRIDTGQGPRRIVMLSDLGNGDAFDDPGNEATRRSYVTLHGAVLASQDFRAWGSPELVGYVCAMVADRFARSAAAKDGKTDIEPGAATWYRQAAWFNNENGYRREGHTPLPFSTTTIERGLEAMRRRGYVDAERKRVGPDGRRFQHPRLIYTNRFNRVGMTADVIDLATREKLA